MINRLIRLKRPVVGTYVRLRRDAGWINVKLTALTTAISGVIADFVSPWLNLIGWLFPVVIVLGGSGYLVWSWYRRHKPAEHGIRRNAASLALSGVVGTIVLCPIFLVHVVAGEKDKGAVATAIPGLSQLQSLLSERFDRVQGTLERQSATSESIKKSMDLTTALSLLDRAQAARDGSSQGQGAALESLIALGHSYAGADLSGISFQGANLPGIVLSNAVLHFTQFDRANLKGARLDTAGLRFGSAAEADLTGADLSQVYAPFIRASRANFRQARLNRANFLAADLAGADLREADLSEAALAFADLRGADLRGANLQGAYLIGTLLAGAKLDRATVQDTDMLAASIDAGALSAAQRSGACRHQFSDRTEVRVQLIERWPSDRFASGYEFEDLTAYATFPDVAALADKTLPLCRTSPDAAAAFRAEFASWTGMHLDRSYLNKAGRRKFVSEEIKRFNARMMEARR